MSAHQMPACNKSQLPEEQFCLGSTNNNNQRWVGGVGRLNLGQQTPTQNQPTVAVVMGKGKGWAAAWGAPCHAWKPPTPPTHPNLPTPKQTPPNKKVSHGKKGTGVSRNNVSIGVTIRKGSACCLFLGHVNNNRDITQPPPLAWLG